ncbi:MAG: hypothetical protein EA364_03340 [Balneolaceae bacterium]|nr:MAG: hypothetical protein EA364_03340 [Balneolaceae bacterium]
MQKLNHLLFVIGLLVTLCVSNSCSNAEDTYDLSTHIDDIYIPENLDDAFDQLDQFLSAENIDTLKALQSENDLVMYHFSLGLWMRNNWGLWRGSRLTKHFNDLGIYHPDDMSGIILVSYWRRLNNLPVKLEEQIKYYQEFWEKAAHPDTSLIELPPPPTDTVKN